MKIHSIYDNGGETWDRYTVYYKGRGSIECYQDGKPMRACTGMSTYPFSPQGFGMHCYGMPGRHNGKRIKFADLPQDCQKLVRQDLDLGPDDVVEEPKR